MLQTPEGGWWFGRLETGREGWFPTNHVAEATPILRRPGGPPAAAAHTRPRSQELRDTHTAALAASAVDLNIHQHFPAMLTTSLSASSLLTSGQRQQVTKSQHIVPAYRSATPPPALHGMMNPGAAGAHIAPPAAAGMPVPPFSLGIAPSNPSHLPSPTAPMTSVSHPTSTGSTAGTSSISAAPVPSSHIIPSQSTAMPTPSIPQAIPIQMHHATLSRETGPVKQRRGTGLRYAPDDEASVSPWFLGGISREQVCNYVERR